MELVAKNLNGRLSTNSGITVDAPCNTIGVFGINSFTFANISNLNFQTFENFSDLLYSSEIDEQKYHMKVSPRDNINKIKKLCYNF